MAPVPLVGTNTLDTLVMLYALLEARRPALLLHPKLTAAERAIELAATAQRGRFGAERRRGDPLHLGHHRARARRRAHAHARCVASAQASSANLGWQDDDCWLLAMPLARVGGLSIVTRCLAARRTVALAPAFDAARLPQWIEDHRVTLLSLVPTMLAQVLDAHPGLAPTGAPARASAGRGRGLATLARSAQQRLASRS